MKLQKIARVCSAVIAVVVFSTALPVSAKDYTEAELRAMGIYFTQRGAISKCTTSSAASGPTPLVKDAKIFYLGDSLTYGMVKAGGLLDKTKAAGFDVDSAPTINGGTTPIGTYGIGGAYGTSVSATGGITIGDSTKLAVDYSSGAIAQAGAIVIGLGTNAKAEAKADIPADAKLATSAISDTDVATAQAAQIPLLINKIRTYNKTAAIYWINTYSDNPSYANSATVNNTITAGSTAGYTVIDLAAAIKAGTAPKPDGGDAGGSIHYSPSSYGVRSQWLVDNLKTIAQSPQATTTPNASVSGSFDPISLTYPAFPSDAVIANNIETYIRAGTPSSPWLTIPNIGEWVVKESKSRGINPMIVMGIGKQENAYGTVGANARDNNNYFGIKGGDSYVHFNSPLLGMTGFLDALKRNIIDKTHPSYKDITNFYEYVSVHQTGGIHYPGDGMKIFDPQMSVYVSWDTQYNPRNYWSTVASVVSAVSGVQISPDIPAKGSISSAVSACVSERAPVTPTSNAGGKGSNQYVPDCTVNGGNAAIACTAINQLSGVQYAVLGSNRALPKDPSPKLLDCSALVAMAIYRTYGVDLGDICSQQFKTNANFTSIDLFSIQPGDLVGHGTVCGTSGHVAIVASYNAATDDLVIMQASSADKPSATRSGKLSNMDLTWAVKYVGQKTLQPGAL